MDFNCGPIPVPPEENSTEVLRLIIITAELHSHIPLQVATSLPMVVIKARSF
jgi:hypothetical protein